MGRSGLHRRRRTRRDDLEEGRHRRRLVQSCRLLVVQGLCVFLQGRIVPRWYYDDQGAVGFCDVRLLLVRCQGVVVRRGGQVARRVCLLCRCDQGRVCCCRGDECGSLCVVRRRCRTAPGHRQLAQGRPRLSPLPLSLSCFSPNPSSNLCLLALSCLYHWPLAAQPVAFPGPPQLPFTPLAEAAFALTLPPFARVCIVVALVHS